ncbi:hypothetical protein PMAYCL1PPCAC_10679, partial [Pristionchus mayeri]
AGIAVALRQCLSPEFVDYSKQVIANSQALANRLSQLGYALATGGTDNHLCIYSSLLQGLDGAGAEYVLDMAHIACNKNTCPAMCPPCDPATSVWEPREDSRRQTSSRWPTSSMRASRSCSNTRRKPERRSRTFVRILRRTSRSRRNWRILPRRSRHSPRPSNCPEMTST